MTHDNISALMHDIGTRARAAYAQLAVAPAAQKQQALLAAADAVRHCSAVIVAANASDMAAARTSGLTAAQLDRLELTPARVAAMADGIATIAALPDPVGATLAEWTRPNGLQIARVTVPLGVIGMIYEARPNVTADAAALCIKSGNAVILRCGSECLQSAKAIAAAMQAGLHAANLPTNAVQLIPTTDRAAVGAMLTMTDCIDVIIPRGGKSLTDRVAKESRVPTLLHLDGNCHTYVHSAADIAMAVSVVTNAKLRRTGVCGATESIVIDASTVASHLPKIIDALVAGGCAVRGDAAACAADARIAPATDDDWRTEYLDAMVSIKTVAHIDDAIAHINHYGSHHTDAIITADTAAAAQFLAQIDSAIVMHNASTQFADGGEFGMGAEIGIATGRLHARGPVGCEQLVTYKYVVRGNGAVRA